MSSNIGVVIGWKFDNQPGPQPPVVTEFKP